MRQRLGMMTAVGAALGAIVGAWVGAWVGALATVGAAVLWERKDDQSTQTRVSDQAWRL